MRHEPIGDVRPGRKDQPLSISSGKSILLCQNEVRRDLRPSGPSDEYCWKRYLSSIGARALLHAVTSYIDTLHTLTQYILPALLRPFTT